MCASWVLGKSRHSCFSSIKKLLWFIGVENCRYRCHQSPINFNMGWSHICVFHFMWKYMKWLHDDCFQQRIITLGDWERKRERECDRTKNATFFPLLIALTACIIPRLNEQTQNANVRAWIWKCLAANNTVIYTLSVDGLMLTYRSLLNWTVIAVQPPQYALTKYLMND